jgi:hypothetical protein
MGKLKKVSTKTNTLPSKIRSVRHPKSIILLPTIPYLEVSIAVGVGLFLWFLFFFPALQAGVMGLPTDWPVFVIGNGETTSLTTYGKWFFNHPNRFLTDAYSGDAPVLYNYLSYYLVNWLSSMTNIPPAMVDGIYLGPLQGFFFVLLNYFALSKVFGNKRVALLCAIFIGFMWHSRLNMLLQTNPNYLLLFHVPIVSMGMGGTNLVYLLFIPTLYMMHCAYTEKHWKYKVYFGILLGLFLQVHTLTVINVVVINALYLVLQNVSLYLQRLDNKGKLRFCIGSLILLLLIFLVAYIAAKPVYYPDIRVVQTTSIPPSYFASLLILIFFVCFLFDKYKSFYLISYFVTLLVASPYLLGLKELFIGGGETFAPYSQVLPLDVTIIYYFPHLIGAGLGIFLLQRTKTDTSLFIWVISMVIGTFILGMNHLWGWNNHPYRFIVNLQIPLMVAAGYGIYHSFQQRNVVWIILGSLVAGWLTLIILLNVNDIFQGRRIYHNLKVASPQEYTFLQAVHKETKQSDRLLILPEYNYPYGAETTGILLNYSLARGFMPDNRFLVNKEYYKNRMNVPKFLFPEFPANDWQPGWKERLYYFQGADGNVHLADSTLFVTVVNPRLKNGILAVYGMKHFAAMNLHIMQNLYPYLLKKAQDFQWNIVASIKDSALFAAIPPVNLPGAANFERGDYTADGFSVSCNVTKEGPQVLVLAGRDMLKRKVQRILWDGKPVNDAYIDNSVVYCKTPLGIGTHTLTLQTEHNETHRITDDFVSFIALVHEQDAPAYLTFAKAPETLRSTAQATQPSK